MNAESHLASLILTTLFRLEDAKEDDNVCPWDAAPVPSGGPGGATMEEPIKPVKASPQQATRSASAEDPRSPVSLGAGMGGGAEGGGNGLRSHSKPESARKDSAGGLLASREEFLHHAFLKDYACNMVHGVPSP